MAHKEDSVLKKIEEMLDALIQNGWNSDQFESADQWANWIADRTRELAKAKLAAAAAAPPVAKQVPLAAPVVKKSGKRTAEQKIAAAKRDDDKRKAAVTKGDPPKRK